MPRCTVLWWGRNVWLQCKAYEGEAEKALIPSVKCDGAVNSIWFVSLRVTGGATERAGW